MIIFHLLNLINSVTIGQERFPRIGWQMNTPLKSIPDVDQVCGTLIRVGHFLCATNGRQQCCDGSRERRPLPRRLQRAACGDASCAEMQPSFVGRGPPLFFPATSAVKVTSFRTTRHDRAREIDYFIFDLKWSNWRSSVSRRKYPRRAPMSQQLF